MMYIFFIYFPISSFIQEKLDDFKERIIPDAYRDEKANGKGNTVIYISKSTV